MKATMRNNGVEWRWRAKMRGVSETSMKSDGGRRRWRRWRNMHECVNAYAFFRWFKSGISTSLYMRSIDESTGWFVNGLVEMKSSVDLWLNVVDLWSNKIYRWTRTQSLNNWFFEFDVWTCPLRWINHWWKHEARSRADHVTGPWMRPLLVDLPSPTSFRKSYHFIPLL
jgi:hypothetical protein